jgi:hypothetical protein
MQFVDFDFYCFVSELDFQRGRRLLHLLDDFASFPLTWILPLSATSFATDRRLIIREIFINLSNRIKYSSLSYDLICYD